MVTLRISDACSDNIFCFSRTTIISLRVFTFFNSLRLHSVKHLILLSLSTNWFLIKFKFNLALLGVEKLSLVKLATLDGLQINLYKINNK